MVLLTDELIPPSRIDEPLYSLKNETLYERYRYRFLEKNNILGTIVNNIFRWNYDVIDKNLLDRRGNFHNITIYGMTSGELNNVKLPRNLKNIRNVSVEIPNTYEVSFGSFSELFGIKNKKNTQ